ncbi:Arc family DNA-binding protein [Rhodovarius lipocyclicus]|uniref:Arc family DNA-binding protein n=1 Tax=Rhodovarius lipocyclicus TaxID=268410 RepID=UPI00135685D5|nr:Arc family DNA-binding protein [Rhodovarius lipocyclicus]
MADDDEMVRFSQRLPKKLYEQLTAAAKESGRSINGEVVARLEGSFDDTKERLLRLESVVFDETYKGGLKGLVDHVFDELIKLEDRVARISDR